MKPNTSNKEISLSRRLIFAFLESLRLLFKIICLPLILKFIYLKPRSFACLRTIPPTNTDGPWASDGASATKIAIICGRLIIKGNRSVIDGSSLRSRVALGARASLRATPRIVSVDSKCMDDNRSAQGCARSQKAAIFRRFRKCSGDFLPSGCV